jgi:hypothetical protein
VFFNYKEVTMSDVKGPATEAKVNVPAVDHPLLKQLGEFYTQSLTEKDKLARLEMDKAELNKAHAFLVGQNPNTPAGPRCMQVLERMDNMIKNQANILTNLENMMNQCKSQIEFENASAIISVLAKRYDS